MDKHMDDKFNEIIEQLKNDRAFMSQAKRIYESDKENGTENLSRYIMKNIRERSTIVRIGIIGKLKDLVAFASSNVLFILLVILPAFMSYAFLADDKYSKWNIFAYIGMAPYFFADKVLPSVDSIQSLALSMLVGIFKLAAGVLSALLIGFLPATTGYIIFNFIYPKEQMHMAHYTNEYWGTRLALEDTIAKKQFNKEEARD